jgi:hypothetical protein
MGSGYREGDVVRSGLVCGAQTEGSNSRAGRTMKLPHSAVTSMKRAGARARVVLKRVGIWRIEELLEMLYELRDMQAIRQRVVHMY